MNKLGILAINKKSPKDITEGILCETWKMHVYEELLYEKPNGSDMVRLLKNIED
jgi:hypothetical protein